MLGALCKWCFTSHHDQSALPPAQTQIPFCSSYIVPLTANNCRNHMNLAIKITSLGSSEHVFILFPWFYQPFSLLSSCLRLVACQRPTLSWWLIGRFNHKNDAAFWQPEAIFGSFWTLSYTTTKCRYHLHPFWVSIHYFSESSLPRNVLSPFWNPKIGTGIGYILE